MKKETVKPPLGLKPKWLHDEQRHAELVSAIKRRLKKGVDIPDEWIREYKNYVQSKNNKQSIQDAKDKVFNELDKEDFIKKELNNNFSSGGFVTSTVKEMLFGDFENAKSQDFKKGDVLIREWNDEILEYCVFIKKDKDNDYFIYKDFYSLKNKDLRKLGGYCSGFKDVDCKFNWRKATQEEIDKLNKLLGKEVEVDFDGVGDLVEEEEVWWLCNEGYYDSFKKNKKYKQISINEEFITLMDEKGKPFNYYQYQNTFTKLQNKELEEAVKYLNGYAKGVYPIKTKLKKSIETILKHLDK